MAQGRAIDAGPVLEEVERVLTGADAVERMQHFRDRSMQRLLLADLDGAEEAADTAVELAAPMGPHQRTHAWNGQSDVYVARGDRQKAIELAHQAADLMISERASAFCRNGAAILRNGAVAHALAGQREETLGLLRAMPTTDIAVELVTAVPRALLGFPSPETDTKLRGGPPATYKALRKIGYTGWIEVLKRRVDSEY